MKEKIKIIRFKDGRPEEIEDVVSSEAPLTIFLNDEQLLTLLCTPDRLEYLALGFLNSEGIINCREDVEYIDLNQKTTTIRIKTRMGSELGRETVFGKRIITSGCGKGMTFFDYRDFSRCRAISSPITISSGRILQLMGEFQEKSELFRETGGVHSAALAGGEGIIVFAEDLGRHNALDKVFGEALARDIKADDKIILTSGRLSSEIAIKTIKRGAPIIVSPSAPTDLAVRIASQMGQTLIGFARGKRMNVYSAPQRIM